MVVWAGTPSAEVDVNGTASRHPRSGLLLPVLLAVLALPLGRVPAATGTGGVPLNPGDTVTSAVVPAGDEDSFSFRALAGTSLSLTLSPTKGSALRPVLEVRDPGGAALDLTGHRKSRKGKVSLKKLPLPATGRYLIRVSGEAGTEGGFVLKTKARPPRGTVRKKVVFPAGETLDVSFGVQDGTTAKIKISGKGGSFEVQALLTPSGDAVPGAPDLFTRKKNSAKASFLFRDFFGDFRLRLGGGTTDTLLKVSIKTKHPKTARRSFEVDSREPDITSVTPAEADPGETVTVRGENFREGRTVVRFGGRVSSLVRFVSSTELRAVVPPGNGSVSLAVRDLDGEGGAREIPFTIRPYEGPAAKFVILLIGDGMPLASEIALSRYLTGGDLDLSWHAFSYQAPCVTWDTTTYGRYAFAEGAPDYLPGVFDPELGYDPTRGGGQAYDGGWEPPDDEYFLAKLPPYGGGTAKIPATDSAAAATALATGVKTEDRNIAWAPGDDPEGKLETIAERARVRLGAAIGVVSTHAASDATPAAFVAHHRSRTALEEIGHEIAAVTQPDVVIGAGHPDRVPLVDDTGRIYLSPTDLAGLRSGEPPFDAYVFVEWQAGVDGDAALSAAADAAIAGGKKLYALFGDVQFAIPAVADAPGAPSITFTAEGKEDPTLPAATLAALRVLEARGGTQGFFLVVEAADIDPANHDNDYAWLIGAMDRLEEAVKTVVAYVDDTSNALTWSNTLVIVTSDHSNGYMRFDPTKPLGAGDLPRQVETGEGGAVSYSGEAWAYPDGEVLYRAGKHTNEPVMVYAEGAGAALFARYEGSWYPGTRLLDNTQIYEVILRAMGLE